MVENFRFNLINFLAWALQQDAAVLVALLFSIFSL